MMTGPDRSICKSAREHPRSLLEKESGVSCENIRLSSAGGNSLRRSRNWRADGDGCDGLHLMQVSRGGLKGLTVCSVGSEPRRGSLSDRILIARKTGALIFPFQPRPLTRPDTWTRPLVSRVEWYPTDALRCEKTAQNYASFVALALGFILIKSVHTA